MDRIMKKAKELNKVMTDINLTVEERQKYVDTLTESEMRGIFKELMITWTAKENVSK